MRFLVPAAALLLTAGAADAATPVGGRWLTEEGNAVVTIGACGAATCGRITRLIKGPPSGPPVDRNNPDAKLRVLRRRSARSAGCWRSRAGSSIGIGASVE